MMNRRLLTRGRISAGLLGVLALFFGAYLGASGPGLAIAGPNGIIAGGGGGCTANCTVDGITINNPGTSSGVGIDYNTTNVSFLERWEGTGGTASGSRYYSSKYRLQFGGAEYAQFGAGTADFPNTAMTVGNSLTIGSGGTAITASIRGTGTLDFASAAGGACSADLTITVTGAAAGGEVSLGIPNGSVPAGSQFFGWISASNTVTVRHCCVTGTCNPASGTFSARVTQP